MKQIFDATQQMETKKNYETVFFNDMYLSFMQIDPNIIWAQENAWTEFMKYANNNADSWGNNPSM